METSAAIKTLWFDESGDCGFKFNKGSTRYFVVVAVYTEHQGLVEETVRALKQQYSLGEGFEFKFSRCRHALKESFLQLISSAPISYKAIIVDKKNLKAPGLQYHSHELYCEAVRRLLYDNDPPLMEATLLLDEATAKIHAKEFQGVLKKYVSKRMVHTIRQVRSESTIMVQIADMIAGSIFRMYEKGNPYWHEIIRSKEKIKIEF